MNTQLICALMAIAVIMLLLFSVSTYIPTLKQRVLIVTRLDGETIYYPQYKRHWYNRWKTYADEGLRDGKKYSHKLHYGSLSKAVESCMIEKTKWKHNIIYKVEKHYI